MDSISQFLAGHRIGVVGASRDPDKYGHKVLVDLLAQGYDAIPIHPRETELEGRSCVRSVADLPADVDALSVITPPKVTEEVVDAAIAKGIARIWMQPGAESAPAVARARAAGIDVIEGGPCLLVALRTRHRT